MDKTITADGVNRLADLIREIDRAGLASKSDWRAWRKDQANLVSSLLNYRRGRDMPEAGAVISPFFHPDLPLIGLNYTQVAHNTLHLFGELGWTVPIRLCRGIVFERSGRLVALPFPKFFNYGEHPETRHLPSGPFEATVKHDGHLGIVFEYQGRWQVTTRGTFGYKTALRGQEMLEQSISRTDWPDRIDRSTCPLVEIIHPETKVHLRYRKPRLILIGAQHRLSYDDFDHARLRRLGQLMGLEVTRRWSGRSIEGLEALMRDLSVRNREGFVVRFPDGRRVKFKFKSYISLMIAAKLTPYYVMNRLINGSYQRLIGDLEYEVQAEAAAIVNRITEAAQPRTGETVKQRRQRLYDLLPDPKSQYQRGICREFLKFLDSQASEAVTHRRPAAKRKGE